MSSLLLARRSASFRPIAHRPTERPSLPSLPVVGPDEDAYLLRLGRTIARVRKHYAGLGQQELADRIGVAMNTISRWENGATSLSAYDLSRLWQALNCPAEWLLNPED